MELDRTGAQWNVGAALKNYIISIFGDGNRGMIVHLDGARGAEKEYTHAARKNDDDPNDKGMAPASNCKIIKNVTSGPIRKMLDEYVRQATLKFRSPVDKSVLDFSKRIFFDKQDIMLTTSTARATNNDLFTQSQRCKRIKGILALRSNKDRDKARGALEASVNEFSKASLKTLFMHGCLNLPSDEGRPCPNQTKLIKLWVSYFRCYPCYPVSSTKLDRAFLLAESRDS
ncbi:hypothetical protein EC968_001067 [Mortierella alpina]|nr:hypothetical protein EC968_001067 [Mortierella alpina]